MMMVQYFTILNKLTFPYKLAKEFYNQGALRNWQLTNKYSYFIHKYYYLKFDNPHQRVRLPSKS